MKSKIFILIALLCAQVSFAKTTIIAGHFDKPDARTVTLQYYTSIISRIEWFSTKREITLDSNNTFSFEIESDLPLTFHLISGENWLMINKYAAVGDSLFFDFRKGTIDMTSKCEDCLAFSFEWEEKFYVDSAVNAEFNSSPGNSDRTKFSDYWNKRRRDQLNYFTSYFKEKNCPQDFQNYLVSEINYDYAIFMLQYSWRNKSAKGVSRDPKYMAFLDSIPVDNPSALSSGHYINFLRELPYTIFSDNIPNGVKKRNYFKHQTQIRDSIAKIYFKGITYDLALYYILFDELRSLEREKLQSGFKEHYNNTDQIFSTYCKQFSDQSYAVRLKNKLHELNNEAKPAPDFTLTDLEGKKVKLSDFKGKVVYLDFWATTCAPCMAEIPKANELKQKFENKNVVFIYVSLDRSAEKLKSVIAAKSFKGIHLMEADGTNARVSEQYEVSGIPHYFLIDKKGLLVNRDAPRPSLHPEELIEKLLLEN